MRLCVLLLPPGRDASLSPGLNVSGFQRNLFIASVHHIGRHSFSRVTWGKDFAGGVSQMKKRDGMLRIKSLQKNTLKKKP